MPCYCSRCGTKVHELAGQCKTCRLTFSQPGLKSTQPPPRDVRGVSEESVEAAPLSQSELESLAKLGNCPPLGEFISTKYSGQTGSGCGGHMHRREGCPFCKRRVGLAVFPYPRVKNMGKFAVIHSSSSWGDFFLRGALGFLIIAGAVAIFLPRKDTALGSGIFQLGCVAFGVGFGVFVVYRSLFCRRTIVIDRERGEFIDSTRALFSRRETMIYHIKEIAFIGLEEFNSRGWEDGKLKSEGSKANVWLEMLDGRVYSIGPGHSTEVRSLAEGLHDVMGIPVREIDPKLCPTDDTWTLRVPDDCDTPNQEGDSGYRGGI